ncbi:cyclopropane-fatty-acyl-phospholipid synthase [Thioalkalivibrio denitrificans]|uniref:Cyclopropane-fatty-acyl-phospholipid synthase n=1 Tax=Thioalkalivibrio denitrificans TaxID=108003 RepID=A0A1V3NI41_9GAMM|nr:cyclopropane fatty acyl phospholipid synthase [Thioalkalivibrio denitrificans]OOG24777.1 cyclopropane-fatty-acyl-phospholipid synthase [Thioalkalivibrio denitrificans]
MPVDVEAGRGALAAMVKLLSRADVRVNGDRPWDIILHDESVPERVLAQGSLGLGEAYMDGHWSAERLDEFFTRVLSADLDREVARSMRLALHYLRHRFLNLQNMRRAWQVGEAHYDLGNTFYEKMLDRRMTYTCGYWEHASSLDEAQEAKLDMICRKLGLRPGQRVLDIGCGWGSFMQFAAEHYGVECVGVTISKAQAEYGRARCEGLPVEFRLVDYREVEEAFDHVVSVGMFEHVGHRNHRAFFEVARRCLKEGGLCLLHTIGKLRRGSTPDPWIDRYIFPNGDLPSLGQISEAVEDLFVIEDVHNFGADYDRTLMAWNANFQAAWPELSKTHDERFKRMWEYYLHACAGAFRARKTQVWQLVLSPNGVPGGYRRPI